MLSKQKVVTKIMTVTPDLAQKWLECNTHNRPIQDRTVKEYGDQMLRGLWKLNGEAIVFDWNNVLVDGQHRLYACFTSNKDFETVVVEGVDPDTFDTIDTGAKRSAADVLHIAGHSKNRHVLAAAATGCLEIKSQTVRRKYGTSRHEVLLYVERNPKLEEWVARTVKSGSWTRQYASTIAAVAYLGSTKYQEKAEEFVDKFVSGENLPAKHPILALRNRLASEKHLTKMVKLTLAIMAWNAHVEGRDLSHMLLPKGAEFPKLKGMQK